MMWQGHKSLWFAYVPCERDCGLHRSECSGTRYIEIAVHRYEHGGWVWCYVDRVDKPPVVPEAGSEYWIEVVW